MSVRILISDVLEGLSSLPKDTVRCAVTSPPYWGLRDYGCPGQIGLEETPEDYVRKMVDVFREVRRVLTKDGTLWLNLGDCYAGSWGAQSRPETQVSDSISARQILAHPRGSGMGSLKNTPGLKNKDLVGIPWRVAFALREDGWHLRQDIVWHKPNPMPESVRDRCTKAHEYIFLLSKSDRYFFDAEAISEPCVWRDNGSSFTSARKQVLHGHIGKGPGTRKIPAGGETTPGTQESVHRAGRTRKSEDPDPPFSSSRMGKNRDDARAETGNHDNPFGETRNKRSVWTVPTAPFREAHFATFPEDLIRPCILAGTEAGDTVLDPFGGAGTTGLVAQGLGRKAVLIELNPRYAALAHRRLRRRFGIFSSCVLERPGIRFASTGTAGVDGKVSVSGEETDSSSNAS